jgi:hypothetical protein
LLPDVDLLGIGRPYAVVEAFILAALRTIGYDRRVGDRLFSAEQGFQADRAGRHGSDGNTAYVSEELPTAA